MTMVYCPNCEKDTNCTHEAELYVCEECGEDFAKYIVPRKLSDSDVSMTQDVLTDVKNTNYIENTGANGEYARLVAELDELRKVYGECKDAIFRRDEQTSEHLKWMAEQGNTITGLRNELKECYEMIARLKEDAEWLATALNLHSTQKIEKSEYELICAHIALMIELEDK